MIQVSYLQNKWAFVIFKQQPLNITHLTFADDLILFCQGTDVGLTELLHILHTFCYILAKKNKNFLQVQPPV